MTSDLYALCIDANDPPLLARFWAGVLGRELRDDPSDGPWLVATDDVELRIRFRRTEDVKTAPNQMHFDLTSRSLADQEATVERALALGAQHLDIGQAPDEGHVVLADPEGNEFCVIEPGNTFTAGCGTIGALSSDGSQAVGYFWSQALGWPLVWDQDEETAVQSPRGGSKISWGGPPVRPKTGRNRLHLDLAAPVGAGPLAEVERLVALGATRPVAPQPDAHGTPLLDPDGNEFCLLAPPPPARRP